MAQLAAILFIQNAHKLAEQHAALAPMERQFAQLIRAGNQANLRMPLAFQKLVAERFSIEQFTSGLSQLAKIKISLLDDDHPAAAEIGRAHV